MENEIFVIEKIQSWRAMLRRAVPWKTARYTKGDIEATVIGVTDADGVAGYGYMPAMAILGESSTSAESLLRTVVVPLWKRQRFLGIQAAMREIEAALGSNYQLKFAVEEALWDLLGKKLQVPLFHLIGGLCRESVPVMRMLGLKAAHETAEEARALVEKGFSHIKLKIGLDEKRDLETVRRVRDLVGGEVFISVDANQAYAPMEAVRVLAKMEDARLGVVEQPVKRKDLRGMAFVRKRVTIPIMADEGIDSPDDALRHIDAGAMDAVSIKLWKVGGLFRAREIAAICAAANVGVHIGSTAGSQLLEAIQLHFAATIVELFGGAEIGEFESLSEDPASGLAIRDGELAVPRAPGLGVKVMVENLHQIYLENEEQ